MSLSSVNIRSNVAVYQQIENLVQFAISSGELKSGDQLPSVRELSERLDVNPNTVAKSYRDLEVMGLLYTRRGMGVYINKGVQAKCRDACHKRIAKRIHEVVQEGKAAGLTKKHLQEMLNKSFVTDSDVYGETPKTVLSLAKS